MSFYGNSFYYTAESFARIVLQNSGLNKYITTLPDGNPFTVVPSDTKKELDAPQRNSGLGIQSGNHWIKLATSGNTFQILHNEPGSDDPNIQTFQGCDVENGEVDEEDQQRPVIMGWNQKITVPVISYDTAGHIIPTEGVTYLKMPANPTSALEGRMQQIDGKNAKGEDAEPTGEQSLKTQLYARMQRIDGKNADGENAEPANGQSFKKELYARMKEIDGKNEDGALDESYSSVRKELLDRMVLIDGDGESSLKSQLDKVTEEFSANNEKITKLWGFVYDGWTDEILTERQSLLQRVQTLENQIGQLINDKTEPTE